MHVFNQNRIMTENNNSAKKINPVSIKDIQDLYVKHKQPSTSKVSNMIQLCRDALGKHKHQVLTMEEFISYFDL